MFRMEVLAFCFVGLGGFFSCSAAVKSYDDLSSTQLMALQESESRLVVDDRALQSLENEHRHKKISDQNFAWEYHDLICYIEAEASFQNDILTKAPPDFELPDGATKVMRTIGKYGVEIPCYVLVGILKAGGSFSP